MIYIDINRLEDELPEGWLAKADELLQKMCDAGEDKEARNNIIEKKNVERPQKRFEKPFLR